MKSQGKWMYPEQGELPENNKYVLVHVPDRPWSDNDDTDGLFYDVAKFVRGISEEERDKLSDTNLVEMNRKKTYTSSDIFGNNRRPYSWQTFGPTSYFGQEVYRWAYIVK